MRRRGGEVGRDGGVTELGESRLNGTRACLGTVNVQRPTSNVQRPSFQNPPAAFELRAQARLRRPLAERTPRPSAKSDPRPWTLDVGRWTLDVEVSASSPAQPAGASFHQNPSILPPH